MKCLYGASVQGIQNFIFQTNKLKEIVGASELVEQICTTEFKIFCSKNGIETSQNFDDNFIVKAAGNIKYIFDLETDCSKVFRLFPKHIANFAPGITINQAVVTIIDDRLHEAIDQIELKLKVQRSKVGMPVEYGFMGLDRAKRTGGVAYITREKRKGGVEMICEATHIKRQIGDPEYKFRDEKQHETLFYKISGLVGITKNQIPYDIERIARSGKNSWLAVIHADGNSLGNLLQKLGTNLALKPYDDVKKAFATFSKNLDCATQNASKSAFKKVIRDNTDLMKNIESGKDTYPIRPVILGGDDLTIIIRADLALDFTETFLKEFEKETKKEFAFLKLNYQVDGFENGITACAGIAYIKATYPFHYAVHLAEKLTAKAKKFSKKLIEQDIIPPSSLSIYKVQSSFVEDIDDITEKTLTAHISKVSFDYGPYLINKKDGFPCVAELQSKLKILKEQAEINQTKGISKLRQWISELYKDKSRADFMLDRMRQVEGADGLLEKLKIDKPLEPIIASETDLTHKTLIYDLIQLHSLKY